ncbi:interleukin-10 receptor 1 [Labeo rohita]|uniref:Interleukin-10 receptor 1 n=3 Tax=Labeo rohita TaxID=84645 RepID=A0A498MTJ0_LABRO|nr:Interferon lambda receptor 1 [Labeo rohita]RXN22734.1 interleukin-10 receptor 1 [Labeo rohita]
MELNMTLDIWEGNVTVLWDPPKGAPVKAYYQVQQASYFQPKEWEIVPECNLTTEARCELGNFFNKNMKIKIGLLKENGNFSWSAGRRIRLLGSKLLAPEFDLSSSPNTVKVKIYRKPFLEMLYEYGPSYSVILYPKGHENQALVRDDDDDDGEVEFTSLSTWQEYCVRVKVEMISDNVSNTSLARCIYPSADSSLVISIAVIGVVGVTSFFMFAVCFFLRRPGKMPAVLKSAVNGWNPMNVGLIQVETVTDKGWLLTSNKMAGKSKAFDESKDLLEEDNERRESTDSGVSVGQQHSIKNQGTEEQTGQEDSGCGSLTGTEDSLSSGRRSLEELPFLDGGINSSSESERKEDSGLGMGNQEASDNLSGMDGDLLSEIVVGDGYRSQSPSADTESEATLPCEAVASSGYRSGHVTCLCSDVETCMWCKTRKLLTDSDSLSHEQTSCTFTTSNDNDKPSYLKKSPLQSVNVLGREDLSEDCDESSLFITCPLLLQEPCQLDTLSLKLGDVELTFT